MSRSYRHTPIVKAGKRDSNKFFKEHAHRAFRRRTKEELSYDDIEEFVPPEKMREVSEIWGSKQDHKWKEFGNFWERCNQRLHSYQVISQRYRSKKYITKYWKRCEHMFKEMFYR